MAASGHIAALSQDGSGTLVARDNANCSSFRVKGEPRDAALSSDGRPLAVTAHGKLTLFSTDDFHTVRRFYDSLECSCFTSSCVMCSVSRVDGDSFALEIREPAAWHVAARTELKDPFGGSIDFAV